MPFDLQTHLLALVAARPEIAGVVSAEASQVESFQTLSEVVRFFAEDPARTLGQANAYFEGTDHAALLSAAVANPLYKQAESPDFHVEEEEVAVLDRLRAEQMARRSEELLRLFEAGTATERDRAEYQDLHARLARAKSGNPPPEERSEL